MSKGDDSKEAVLKYISTHIEDNGWAPSIREIAEGTGRSPNSAWINVQNLKKQGLIEVGPHPRQIRLVHMKAATEEL